MSKGIIIEIRAGAGGEEAAFFASDLFRMYSRFAEKQGWKTNLIERHIKEAGGCREIIFGIKGDDVYDKLKQEAGVHRVQRIPTTEKSGRIHTSTASVAIMPEVAETELKIDPRDLRIDVLRSSGPGGQHVNKTESAVRIIHKPTGIMVNCQEGRSQQHNKEIAMNVLRARLLAKKQSEEMAKESAERREQIGSAMRAEKIRTYNFPQNRVTDHRINKSWHNLEKIIEGDLKPIIKAFQKK
ncbi:PCRF domain-containing protein [Patescibacteria group bacterium]|nr:PCRF domain-containing protein [Patescibacteria group bacterium]MBU2579869.1 PCRF domain-containing protein [Patescibacteria group bacterium]MBU4030872.1 PCRF domain-containing protein [Patescibacteria group bacterium]MBU4082906.1 PCRF domain-containing protein [Patescibacteria group bacterium]